MVRGICLHIVVFCLVERSETSLVYKEILPFGQDDKNIQTNSPTIFNSLYEP